MSRLIRYTQSRERPDQQPPSQIFKVTVTVESVSPVGRSIDGASAQGTVTLIASPVGRCVTGASSQGVAAKIASVAGASAAGSLAQGIAAKIATVSGTAVGGSLAQGVATHIAPRSGLSAGGALAQGAALHIGIPIGSSVAGASTQGIATSTDEVSPIGRSFAGGSIQGTAALTVISTGVSAASSLAQGTAAVTAMPLGSSVAGSLTYGTAGGPGVISPVGICAAGSSAQGSATTTDWVTVAMEAADIFVGPLMNELLLCLCEQSAQAANPPGICCFRVGTEVAHDAGINLDQCCEGIGYVMLGDTWPSTSSFPEQDIVRQAYASCAPPTWGQSFQIGLIRCVPVGNEFNPLPCNDWNEAAIQNVIDAQTLRRVACCFRDFVVSNNDKFMGMSVVIERQTQGSLQGGCIERSMTIVAQIPNCDGC